MTNWKKNLKAIPVILWMGALVGIPMVFVFVLSFLSKDNMGNILLLFTLDNYKRMADPLYLKIFANSFILAISTAGLCLLIGYPFAYFVSNLRSRKKAIAMVLLMLPFWTSSLLRTYGWMILLGQKGIINNLLMAAGFISSPLNMMYSFGTVLTGTAYMLIPFMVIAIFNSVDKLDRSLLEASYDLGAGKWKTFFKITLPLTVPGIAGGFTLVFIPALGLFFISDLLGGGQTVFLGNLINNQVTSARNKPLAAALSVGMIVLVLIILLLYRKLTKNTKETTEQG